MKIAKIIFLGAMVASIVIGTSLKARTTADAPDIVWNDPAPDSSVGCQSELSGTAMIQSGQHLWAFASIYDDVWYPQSEVTIDPKTHRFTVRVQYGEANDVSARFNLALAVLAPQEHLDLTDYRRRALKTNNWTPIEMPTTIGAPLIRKVQKVSHSKCR